jgi:hypothetical protein
VTDLHHNAYPRVPLRAALGFGVGLNTAANASVRRLRINGYEYFDRTDGFNTPPPPDLDRTADLRHLWQEVRPQAESLTAPLKAYPVDGATLSELRDHALALTTPMAKLWALHRTVA